MTKLGKTLLAAAAVVVFSTPAANAAVMANCTAGGGLACFSAGNDKEATVEAGIFAATGNTVDLFLYGKSDQKADASKFVFTGLGTKAGTWHVVDPSIKIAYVTVKASDRFAIYNAGGVNAGSWTTAGLLNGGGKQPDLSHLSFWTTPTSAVPEPAAWMTMIAGFGMVGVSLRRRKSNIALA